ncbi:hypothetical protein BGLA2_810045 [Burkholderia gladioli]|nr:hypothetical protein BGLA2_810045 [Burkholderia gladioli]
MLKRLGVYPDFELPHRHPYDQSSRRTRLVECTPHRLGEVIANRSASVRQGYGSTVFIYLIGFPKFLVVVARNLDDSNFAC